MVGAVCSTGSRGQRDPNPNIAPWREHTHIAAESCTLADKTIFGQEALVMKYALLSRTKGQRINQQSSPFW